MSLSGPRVFQGGQVPRGLGQYEQNPFISRIDPIFDQTDERDSTKLFRLKRAVGFHDRVFQRYWVFVPCESTTGGARYANSGSITFVYDYQRDAWLEWDKVNMAGGVAAIDDQVLFTEKRYSDFSAAVTNFSYRFHNSGLSDDYIDHTSAISAYWKSPWDFMGEASILKSFLAIRVFSTEEIQNDFSVRLQTERDWIADTESDVTITSGAGGYGQDQYGLDPWGSPTDPTLTRKLNNSRVKSLRVIFSNEEIKKNFLVTGYELEVAAPYKPRFVQ